MKMQMFKAVYGKGGEVEQAANEWFANNPGIKVAFMSQSHPPGSDDVEPTITILYHEPRIRKASAPRRKI
jgi:hypothetical protein